MKETRFSRSEVLEDAPLHAGIWKEAAFPCKSYPCVRHPWRGYGWLLYVDWRDTYLRAEALVFLV
jgi:hypothetical protein